MTIFFRAFRSTSPFTPQSGGVGLLVKRAGAVSQLSLTQDLDYNGTWNHDTGDEIYLDDAVTYHNNHGSDPGASALSMADSATFSWSRNRSLPDTLNLTSFAHASLDGYHPSTGGDPDLSKHVMVASGNIAVGQPVYIINSNTVTWAEAVPNGSDYSRCQVFGLCQVAGTNGNDVTILTDGYVERDNWGIITGTLTLTVGALYYLSETVGQLTETPPSSDGSMIVRVGRAFTPTKLDIEIGETAIL